MNRPLLWFAVLVHLTLATAYAWTTPAFEAPDEGDHFRAASFLSYVHRLPYIPGTAAELGGVPGLDEEQVAHHPPLYYGILAGWMNARGMGDTTFSMVTNPDLNQDNKASRHLTWLHGCDETTWHRWNLLFELRLLSVICGLITLVCTHRLGRKIFPDRPGIADIAALAIACLPMFSFITGALDNGNLAMALSHVVYVVLATVWQRGQLTWKSGLRLAVLTGMALMTKMTAMTLLPLLAAMMLWSLRTGGDDRASALRIGMVGALMIVAMTGWFFLRNLSLYGDVLGAAAHAAAFKNIAFPQDQVWDWICGEFFPDLLASFLGRLGWMTLPMPDWFAWPAAALGALAVVGLVEALIRRDRRPALPMLALLAIAFLGALAIVVRFNMTFRQPQGRYLFSAVGPAMLLLSLGIHTLLGRRLSWPKPARILAAGLPVAAAMAIFWASFRPAFDPALAPADRFHSSFVSATTTPPDQPEISLKAPAAAAVLRSPPTFVWESPNPQARVEIHIYDGTGRLWIATHAWFHLEIGGGQWTLPAAGFDFLPKSTPLFWKVRELPDRCAGQQESDMAGSAARWFKRVD